MRRPQLKYNADLYTAKVDDEMIGMRLLQYDYALGIVCFYDRVNNAVSELQKAGLYELADTYIKCYDDTQTDDGFDLDKARINFYNELQSNYRALEETAVAQ